MSERENAREREKENCVVVIAKTPHKITKNTKNTKKQTQNPANRHVVHAYNAYKMIWGWGWGRRTANRHVRTTNNNKQAKTHRLEPVQENFGTFLPLQKQEQEPQHSRFHPPGRRRAPRQLLTFGDFQPIRTRNIAVSGHFWGFYWI